MMGHLMLSLFVALAVMIGLPVIEAKAGTKGQELERRQNQRTDDWAAKQKQQAREQAENQAGNTGIGREKRLQDREREIDRQAAQRKKDDAEARSRLPKEKMNEPYTEKKPETKPSKPQPRR